jgi:hypothetical protein
MPLANASPYAALDAPLLDLAGREVIVVIVKATFVLRRDGKLVLADEPVPIRPNDVLRDPDNPRSSALYPSDLCAEKPGTDVIVVGDAVSRTPVTSMDVAVKVREVTAPLRVHGERLFYRGLTGVSIGPAAAFERKPISYEKAYGGATEDWGLVESQNPAGVGVARSAADLCDTPAPQIEHPARPHTGAGDKHPPAGYGALLTSWSPRRERAGTFDEVWQATRMPLLPLDFDPRFHNVAHPSLTFEEPLAAGDTLSILGMHEDGLLAFCLPALGITLRARFEQSGRVAARPVIDTVLIEPGKRQIELVVRKAFRRGRGRDLLRELAVDLDA